MKSQIFKSAWKLFREMNINWSEALRISWAAAKQNAKVFVTKSFNGICRIAYSAETSNGFVQAGSLEEISTMLKNHRPIDLSGAAAYYGCGHYNAD